MSNTAVHDFKIPHHLAQPTRDMIILRLPMPPRKVGSLLIPDMFRDMAMHNVMAGRIVAMGPVAFAYKDGSAAGVAKQPAELGDWVIIRPFAGTMMSQDGQASLGGWRYVSSFNDAIAVVKAADMPDPATLVWDEDASQQAVEGAAVDLKAEAVKASIIPADTGVRERTVYKSEK